MFDRDFVGYTHPENTIFIEKSSKITLGKFETHQ